MPVPLSPGLEPEVAPQRKRWTADEYVRFAEQGFLPERGVELLDGDILIMSPESLPPFKATNRILRRLASVFGLERVVSQNTTHLTELDMPAPDVAVLAIPVDDMDALPTSSDLRLVVEVSLTSLGKDRDPKASLYARVGIPEYWIVNLRSREIEVHRDPAPDGYREIRRIPEEGTIAPPDAPDEAIPVGELLP